MRRYISLLTIAFVALIQITGCIKEDTIPAKTTMDLLVGKKWKLVAMSVKEPSGSTVPDAYNALPPYRKDDYFLFNADSSYELNDNIVLKDTATSKILDAGDWELINGNKFLEMHSTVFTVTYNPSEIKELTETKLYLETKYPGDGSIIWTTYSPL